LERSTEYRKNEMVMLEEFRRRKKMKDYFDLMKKRDEKLETDTGENHKTMDFNIESLKRENLYKGMGPERFFETDKDEIFNTKHFHLIFIDSDSVTNVTKLNRINHRRVLLWIGNCDGVLSYGKGKGLEYEGAFEQAFKRLRQNLICIPLDRVETSVTRMEGRHNDFKIKIWPTPSPNFWGNPHIWKMLLYSGLTHCRFMCKSRKRDPYSMVYAYFNAVTQNTTPKICAE
jgi:ribosomal protein S5